MDGFSRPKLTIPKSSSERVADGIGYIALVFMIGYIALSWASIPDQVPAHFGVNGEVDRWGSKWELFILPVIGISMYFFLQFLERKPHVHNFPARLNESNAPAFYFASRQFINFTKNICMVLFAYITWDIVLVAQEKAEGLGMVVFGTLMVLFVALMIWHLVRTSKIK